MDRIRSIRPGKTPFTDDNGDPVQSHLEIVTYIQVPEGYRLVPEKLTSTMELVINTSREEDWPPEKSWETLLANLPKYIITS